MDSSMRLLMWIGFPAAIAMSVFAAWFEQRARDKLGWGDGRRKLIWVGAGASLLLLLMTIAITADGRRMNAARAIEPAFKDHVADYAARVRAALGSTNLMESDAGRNAPTVDLPGRAVVIDLDELKLHLRYTGALAADTRATSPNDLRTLIAIAKTRRNQFRYENGDQAVREYRWAYFVDAHTGKLIDTRCFAGEAPPDHVTVPKGDAGRPKPTPDEHTGGFNDTWLVGFLERLRP